MKSNEERLQDLLAYVDSLSPGDTAAKAAVDIALHDLVGKLLEIGRASCRERV